MRTGSAVASKAGGDKGRTYVIVGFDEKGYALVCDGRRHPLCAPRKKNVEHLSDTGLTLSGFRTDAMLVTAIRRLGPSEK